MKEKEIVANNLKRFRQFKGLTQAELGKKIGLTRDTISKLELGKQQNIGMKYLVSICHALDVQVQELFMEASCIPLRLVISDESVKTLERILTIITNKK